MSFHSFNFGRRIWKLIPCFLLFAVQTVVPANGAETWRPAKAPLMTRWAAEIGPTNTHAEYPRPQLVRTNWMSLNGLWNYAIVPSTSDLPGKFDGQILVPFPVESALSGVMQKLDATNTLWYQRRFFVPENWSGQRIRLHFGAVDWQANVVVNGHSIGQHRGGYDRFSFDITDALLWNVENEITVAVTDPTEGDQPRGKQSRKPEGIFYTASSGIWQTVWLEPVPVMCIDELRMVPDLDAKLLKVRINVNSLSENLRVDVTAFMNGQPVGKINGPPNTELILPLQAVRAWSPDDPFLYDLQVTLKKDGGELDHVSSYFGMRKIALTKDDEGFTRIALNDKFLFQIGTLDQGFWPDGLYTAPSDAALRSDIETLKQLGFNLTRKHVKVEPDRWYYWCDKLGLLVWQDIPSGNNTTAEGRRIFEAELLQIIRELQNHPSIVTWVLFNEGWGQYDTERLTQMLKNIDPSRLVNNASGWTDMRVGDMIDVHTYPGPIAPDPEAKRAAVLGEFGGLGLSLQDHAWSSRSWSYIMLTDTNQLNLRYTELLRRVWLLHDWRGLSAAIYTQSADVETEANGVMTYDRAVTKLDPATALAANRGAHRGPAMKVVMSDALFGRSLWRYTTKPPAEDWFEPEFDATDWKEGVAGFGTSTTPGSRINTAWDTPDIWLRREFVLNEEKVSGIKLRVFHDEGAEIYLNGVLATRLKGYITVYDEFEVSPEALAALRSGKNVIAVHCHQATGGQGIDVGILVPKTAPASVDIEASENVSSRNP